MRVMKQLFIFFSLFMSVAAYSQKQAVFDFTSPQSLNPSISPADEGNVSITSKTFTDGKVSLSFSTQTEESLGARLQTINATSGVKYYLKTNLGTVMSISATAGCNISKIEFSDDCFVGDLGLKYGQSGTFDNKVWTNTTSSSITEVLFYHSTSQPNEIRTITVTYSEPTEVLIPSISIAEGTVSSFKSLTLSFSKTISSVSQSGISVTFNGTAQTVSVSKSGTDVTLSLSQAISTDGTIKVTVPAGCITTTDGYQNEALSYTYTVKEDRASLSSFTADPSEGTVESLPKVITLKYDDEIRISDSGEAMLYYEGNPKAQVKLSKSETDVNTTVLTIDTDLEAYTEEGTYKINVPEGYIHNNFLGNDTYDRWNPEFTLTYTVGTVTPPEPEDSETMKAAKALLEKTGVGYPAVSSDAYKALYDLVNQEDTPDDDALTEKMNALYAVSDVVLPETGKYYKIAGVNSDGEKLYLAYDGTAVSLSSNASDAATFAVTQNADKTVTLKTTDNKYMYVLSDLSSSYASLNDNNVTIDSTEINNLTFAKFALDDVDASTTYGLMTMYGSLGQTKLGTAGTAYALIDFDNSAVSTVPNDATLMFGSSLSSAFAFTETSKPAETESVDVSVSVSVSTVDEESTLSLLFSDVTSVSLVSETASVYDSEGAKVADATLDATSTSNLLTISLGAIEDGTYKLVIPSGTLTCVKDGSVYNVNAISATFTVKTSTTPVVPSGDFNYTYSTFYNYKEYDAEGVYKDTHLNDWIIYNTEEDDMAPSSNVVKIVNANNFDDIIRYGVMQRETIDIAGVHALKLVFTDGKGAIEEGDFAKGTYTIIFPAATWGDSNFAKYLESTSSVSASSCKVNPQLKLTFTINNEVATSIQAVGVGGAAGQAIYDLSGRRLKSVGKPGLYIINGKKVVVK